MCELVGGSLAAKFESRKIKCGPHQRCQTMSNTSKIVNVATQSHRGEFQLHFGGELGGSLIV